MIAKVIDINYKTVWNLAWPIILSNISIPLIGATNIAVVGRLPSEIYIGAVALGVMVLQCIYWSFSFLRKGTTGLVAQAMGRHDTTEMFAVLVRALMVAVTFGAFVTSIQSFILWIAFEMIHAEAAVEVLAKQYFDIRIWGTIATMGNYVMLGWFYGIQKPKLALILRVAMNILNIPLAIYLALTLNLGVAGVAYSALISHIFVFVLSLLVAYVLWVRSRVPLADVITVSMHFKQIVAVVKINGDLFVRTLLVFFAFSWFTSASAGQDSVTLAANTILINLFWFLSYTLDGFSNAAEVLVGQSYGAINNNRLWQAVAITTKMSCVFALLFTLIYYLAGAYLIDYFTHVETVRILAKEYLPWLVGIPIVGIWCFQLDGIYIGMTQTSMMMLMMLIAFAVYALAILVLPHYLGNHGLWLALYIFLVVRAVTLYIPLRAQMPK